MASKKPCLQESLRLHGFILAFDDTTNVNTVPYLHRAHPSHIVIHTSVTPNLHLTMSVSSSRQTLDLEMSSGSTRRARPSPSPHSPLSPRSPVRDMFDGRVDRDYFGQKDDVSDMKVSAICVALSNLRIADFQNQRMGKSQHLARKFEMVSTIGFTSCVMGYVRRLVTSRCAGTRRTAEDTDFLFSPVLRRFCWPPVESVCGMEGLLGFSGRWSGSPVANSS